MKGQNQALTPILITGIMIAVVSTAYLWGMPLIQKNKDTVYLKRSEAFMNDLSNRIKFVANNGGKSVVYFNIPGTFRFFPDQNYVEINLTTDGTIYSVGGTIYFVGSKTIPTNGYGVWGSDDPYVLHESTRMVGKKYMTSYVLQTFPLCEGARCYEIDLTGKSFSVGPNHQITIENVGTDTEVANNIPGIPDGSTITISEIKLSFS